jgi:hypothetical protein
MAPNPDPQDQVIEEADRRESVSDWIGLAALIAALCIGFVLLVAAGYGLRALFRSFG